MEVAVGAGVTVIAGTRCTAGVEVSCWFGNGAGEEPAGSCGWGKGGAELSSGTLINERAASFLGVGKEGFGGTPIESSRGSILVCVA